MVIKLPDMKCKLRRCECALGVHKCRLWLVCTSLFTAAILFFSVRIRWKSTTIYNLVHYCTAFTAYSNTCIVHAVVNTDVRQTWTSCGSQCTRPVYPGIAWPPNMAATTNITWFYDVSTKLQYDISKNDYQCKWSFRLLPAPSPQKNPGKCN